MKNLAFVSDLIARDPNRCAQSLPIKGLVPFRQCSNAGTINGTLPGDPRVLPFCGTHAKAPNVTILDAGEPAELVDCPGCERCDTGDNEADCTCDQCPSCERWLLCATCDVCPSCSPTGHGTFEFAINQ